jgi:hypothetical protein
MAYPTAVGRFYCRFQAVGHDSTAGEIEDISDANGGVQTAAKGRGRKSNFYHSELENTKHGEKVHLNER